MGKKISLIAILTGVACLTGCSASNNSPSSVVDQMPARIACIQLMENMCKHTQTRAQSPLIPGKWISSS